MGIRLSQLRMVKGMRSGETAFDSAMGSTANPLYSVTGSAGPEPQDQPPGTMIVAVATPEGAMARTFRLPGDRERVRTYAATAALHLTRLAVAGDWWT